MKLTLPAAARTIRARLALTYSAVLFGLVTLILGGLYLAMAQTIDAAPLDPVTVQKFTRTSSGKIVYKPGEQFQAADLESVQQAVNFTALQTVRDYSLIALVIMFALSLAIGWWVAGRALRPVEQITTTTRDINATDLTRRIGATGPKDELTTLADTIDSMLARLERAFRAERSLVEDVSHELRNPVAVVQANVEAVLGREDAAPAERQEAAAVVTRATSRMSRLLDDLLATARTRSGAFTDSEVDVAALATGLIDEVTLLAADRSVSIGARIAAGPTVWIDPELLSRAVMNVLSNAVRLAPSSSEITVAVGSQGGWAYVAVRDAGPGIAAQDRDRVFERFQRGTGDTTSGSGLGLAIARQIVESYDGRLVLAEDSGPGSTFVIWLPERATAGPDRGAVPPAVALFMESN